MRKSILLTTGVAVVAALVLGGGATLALQGIPVVQSSALQDGQSGPIAAQISLDEVREVMNLADAKLITLDTPTLAQAAGGFEIVVPIDGVMTTIALTPQSVRADGYRLIAQVEDGSYQDLPPGPVNTFRGFAAAFPGSSVAGAIEESGLFLHILMPDRTLRVVEPLVERVNNAGPRDYVSFQGADSLGANGVCGTDHSALPEADENQDPAIELGGCGGVCITQIAYDADFEYFQSRGSSVPNTELRINTLLNSVNNLAYIPEVEIQHVITTIIVRTTVNDPYTSSDSGILLNQFRSHWQSAQTGVVRDVAHLYTGRNIDGGVIGQAAAIGGICSTQFGYCHAQSDCCGSTACAVELTAHELGHLWGGTHIVGGTIMNPSINCDSTPDFAVSTRNEIIAHRNSRTCLSTAAPPSTFNLLAPAPGATAVPLNVLFNWSDAAAAVDYVIEIDDDPAFGTPHQVFPRPNNQQESLTVSQFQPTLPLIAGRTYSWRVVANNLAGATPSNPTTATFTTLIDCNNNGINDSVELQNPANDCNSNGVLDACDLSGAFYYASQDQGPIGQDLDLNLFTQSFTTNAPAAADAVTLTLRGFGDLSNTTEFFNVDINGTDVGDFFVSNGSDCFLVQDQTLVAETVFNAARGAGPSITITVTPDTNVSTFTCGNSFVLAQLSYLGVPTSLDANGNQIPDECDPPGFPPGDMNCDGVLTVADIAGFVLALTDPAGYAAQFPACDINNADINNDSLISVADIGPFVALLTG